MTKTGNWTDGPGFTPPPGNNCPPMGSPTGCKADPSGGEGCSPPGPDLGYSIQVDNETQCESAVCPTGYTLQYSLSPATALDRAFAFANRGYRQAKDATRGLDQVGGGSAQR